MTQGIQEQRAALPAIKPERHFVQIGGEMLCANAMPRSHDPALQERECGFYGIRVYFALHVNLATVIDSFVLCLGNSGFLHREWVGTEIVRHDYINIFGDILANVSGESSGFHIPCVKESEIAATLPNADYDFFVSSAPTNASAFMLSPDIGFVHFDCAIKHRFVSLTHSGPNAMAQVPSGFVADSDSALHLIRREAFAGFHEQEYRCEPSSQGQVGIVENRTSSDGEVIFALSTIELLVSLDPRYACAVASGTLDAIRPTQLNQNFPASFVGIEQALNI
jgi:hypothetical protein